MTVPAPRGPEAGTTPGDATVLGLIYDSVREVKETVAQMSRDLRELPERYVPRKEFDRYRDERSLEFQQAQQRHDVDVAKLQDAQQRAEDAREERERADRHERVVSWRWRIGLAVGAAASFGAALLGHAPTH